MHAKPPSSPPQPDKLVSTPCCEVVLDPATEYAPRPCKGEPANDFTGVCPAPIPNANSLCCESWSEAYGAGGSDWRRRLEMEGRERSALSDWEEPDERAGEEGR